MGAQAGGGGGGVGVGGAPLAAPASQGQAAAASAMPSPTRGTRGIATLHPRCSRTTGKPTHLLPRCTLVLQAPCKEILQWFRLSSAGGAGRSLKVWEGLHACQSAR